MNKSTASAASPKGFVSQKAELSSRDQVGGAPLELGPLDVVFGEAALAADLITA